MTNEQIATDLAVQNFNADQNWNFVERENHGRADSSCNNPGGIFEVYSCGNISAVEGMNLKAFLAEIDLDAPTFGDWELDPKSARIEDGRIIVEALYFPEPPDASDYL